MVLLEINKYKLALEPLKQVKINHLFARAVLEHFVRGRVYLDNIKDPKVFYIYHPYGMSLLFGETGQSDFNSWFYNYANNLNHFRDYPEWIQLYPDQWHQNFKKLFGEQLINYEDNKGKSNNKIEVYTRVNFKFNKDKFLQLKEKMGPCKYEIIHTDKIIYHQMQGKVLPKYFWDSADQFVKEGIGYSLIYEEAIVSTAFSAFIFDNQLEIGIETSEYFRGKGFAIAVCMSLINYSLANNYEPVWSCRLDNVGSYKLAQKLGFEPTLFLPFYRLIV